MKEQIEQIYAYSILSPLRIDILSKCDDNFLQLNINEEYPWSGFPKFIWAFWALSWGFRVGICVWVIWCLSN